MASADLYGLALFAGFGFAVATALLCGGFYPLFRRRLLSLPPATRANYLLAWLTAPLVVGLLLTGLIFVPTVLSHLGFDSDHCTAYEAGFSSDCLLHPSAFMPRDLPWVLFFPLNVLGLAFLGYTGWKLWRAQRLTDKLRCASQLDHTRRIRVVESQWPLALAAGIFKGEIFVSSYLVDSLSPRQLAVVLDHERTHLRRRDPTRYFIAQTIACLHAPWLHRQLLEDLTLATEQACDEAAAKQVGDRLLVADTIVQVERLFHRQRLPALVPSFMGNQVVVRVESLLAEPPERVSVQPLLRYIFAGLIGTALLFVAEPLHQLTEAVLGLLIG